MRTKRAFKVKQKAFFIIFKGLSFAKNCFRPESSPFKLIYIILLYILANQTCTKIAKFQNTMNRIVLSNSSIIRQAFIVVYITSQLINNITSVNTMASINMASITNSFFYSFASMLTLVGYNKFSRIVWLQKWWMSWKKYNLDNKLTEMKAKILP